MTLKRLNGIVQRFRSKVFSPACLFRFSESPAPLPNCDIVFGGRRLRGGGWNRWYITLPLTVRLSSRRNPLPCLPAGRRQERGGRRLFLVILFMFLFLSASISYPSSLKFKDEVGREVAFSFPPKRIVSLAPNVTEILFSLGLDEEIVGVSIHCNFPEKAKTKVQVGSYISLDFERIVSLKPDLIIATGAGNTRDMVERLGKLGFPTYVIFPKNFSDVLRSIGHISQVVDREKEGMGIIKEMKRRRQRVVELTQGLPKPRVFLQIGDAPIVTVGKTSFGDDLIHLVGGENIAGKEKEMYPRLGMEEILKRSPEVIIISSMNPKGDYQKIVQEWSRWKTIPAVKNGRIYLIDSDLVDRPSPRIIEGLEEIARIVHPERFK
jgi:iron complex transport system substrate-binding protein